MKIDNPIQQAVQLLQQGKLVAFPTETVYGLGADAKNPTALASIFRAKGRPIDHPLIVHLAEISQLDYWVINITPAAAALARAFWPGPLTLIFKKTPPVLDMISGGQDTVGIRIPNHPIANKLLKNFGGGLAAPSANRFGRISPTTADAVQEELGESVDLVLDGGQCEGGIESTIVDVSSDVPILLRPGMIPKVQIESILQYSIQSFEKYSTQNFLQSDICHPQKNHQKHVPRVSGSHESHYAPETKTYLIETKQIPQFIETIKADQLPMAFLLIKTKLLPRDQIECITMSTDPRQYAYTLYANLRKLDKKHYKQIVIESVPAMNEEWDAVRDRLSRASLGHVVC